MDTVLGGCEAGNSDLLTLAQRGDWPLFDAFGLEREAQLAFKVVVPAHRALIVRVSVNDDLIDDARLAIARQSTWQVRVNHDGKGSRGIWIMPLMIVAGKR